VSRILKVYEGRFRALLRELNARRLEQGVQWLVERAQGWGKCQGTSRTHGLTHVHERLRLQVEAFTRRARPSGHENRGSPGASGAPSRFLCDAGLGGVARWLRAAGYESIWVPDIEDAELVRQAQRLHATILTTDSLLMERGVLRDGIVPAFWLPPTLTIEEQLALVFREFQLDVRDPRCTHCGVELRRVDKESVRERIPPRTARWLEEYFICAGCGQLFWRGTHWRSISARLQRLLEQRVAGAKWNFKPPEL